VTTAEAIRPPRGAFAALTSRSYRIYLAGQSLANMGTWMQSIAQDWLVLDLTHSATAVGVTMALQFLPMLLFGLHTGLVADRLPKRSILLATQTLNATATSVLAVITLTGAVRVAEVYAFASVSGLIFAFDGPARQAFAAEVVPPSRLRAAIALNAAVFQATRLIGPAIASLLIVSAGTGWVFVVNAACYLSPTIGLLRLRPSDLTPAPAAHREPGALRAAARHLRGRPDVVWTIFLVGMLGTFGLNFPVVLTSMAKSTFHGNAGTYGLFNIVLAIGSASGALLAGASAHPRRRILVLSAAAFGLFQASAAIAPDMAVFLALLGAMGFANLVFQSMANASVQLAVDPELRGRVMGLYMLAFIGGTPIGAPVIGELTSHLGARAGMAICGVVPLLAAVVMAVAARRRAGPDGRAPRGDRLRPRARSPLDRASRQPPDYVALHRQIQQDRQQGKDDPRGLKLIQLDCLVGDEGRNAETSGVQGLIGDERGCEQIVVPAPEERHDPDRYEAWLGQRQKNTEQDAYPAASVDQRCVDDL
jgi:MFS family permease